MGTMIYASTAPNGDRSRFIPVLTGMPESERVAWCEWMKRNGLDPAETVGNGFVEIYEQPRGEWFASYLAYALNDRGSRFVDPTSHGTRAMMTVRTVRLDREPANYPPGEWKERSTHQPGVAADG